MRYTSAIANILAAPPRMDPPFVDVTVTDTRLDAACWSEALALCFQSWSSQ